MEFIEKIWTSLIRGDQTFFGIDFGFAQNSLTEILAIAITILIIDRLRRGSENKKWKIYVDRTFAEITSVIQDFREKTFEGANGPLKKKNTLTREMNTFIARLDTWSATNQIGFTLSSVNVDRKYLADLFRSLKIEIGLIQVDVGQLPDTNADVSDRDEFVAAYRRQLGKLSLRVKPYQELFDKLRKRKRDRSNLDDLIENQDKRIEKETLNKDDLISGIGVSFSDLVSQYENDA